MSAVDASRDGHGGLAAAELICGSCHAHSSSTGKFCPECGARLTQVGRSAEYKQVTVLFADVVHSMDIAAALDMERLREIMTDLLERSAAVARRYGGGTVEYAGDGLMVIFGAPVALEDHAFRACLAALAIQEGAARLAAEVTRRDGVALQLRVGLNSGRVIAGEVGSGSLRYAATGEAVGFAHRMESVAPPGGVMLSEATALLVEHTVMLAEPESVRIKGSDEPAAKSTMVCDHREISSNCNTPSPEAIAWTYGFAMQYGVLRADDPLVRASEDAVETAQGASSDRALGLAAYTLAVGLLNQDDAADRRRGLEWMMRARDVWSRKQVQFLIPVTDIWAAREAIRCGDRDAAIRDMRRAVDELREGYLFYRVWGTGVLVETLLERDTEGDLTQAHELVDWLANLAADGGSVMLELMLLRQRALLARVRGDVAYPDLVSRYRAMAESLGFEGHIAWAEEMVRGRQ